MKANPNERGLDERKEECPAGQPRAINGRLPGVLEKARCVCGGGGAGGKAKTLSSSLSLTTNPLPLVFSCKRELKCLEGHKTLQLWNYMQTL